MLGTPLINPPPYPLITTGTTYFDPLDSLHLRCHALVQLASPQVHACSYTAPVLPHDILVRPGGLPGSI